MWRALEELDFLPLLWSAYPLHPHGTGDPLSNRKPSVAEATEWSWSWRALMDLFAITSVVAVGNVAHEALERSGLRAPRVRHPSHGGKALFTQGLRELLEAGVIS